MDRTGNRAYKYAESLAEVLAEQLETYVRCERGDESGIMTFAKAFCWHAARIFENYEDLGTLLVLELYEDRLIGTDIDKRQVHRVLTRIRKRLARNIREQQLTAVDDIEHWPDESKQNLVDAIRELSPDEALIAETLLDKRDEKLVMNYLQLSRATYYRLRNSVKAKLKNILKNPS